VIRNSELAVLGVLERGDTITDVAAKVDRDESHVSRTVSDLEEKGFVRTERDGRYKRVNPSDARAVELYQDLVRHHDHVDFPELLGGVALEVLLLRPSTQRQ
jgi:predicted transcriptional regulator